MDNNVHSTESVIDVAKADATARMKRLVTITIDAFFDFLEDKVHDFPETVKQLYHDPELEQKINDLWSEHLFAEGLIPKEYSGLPDNLLISNFHQDGYLDGLYVGYMLAMMALTDNDVPKDIILAIRDYIRPNLIGQYYKDRDDVFNQYQNERYNWIDKIK